MFASRIALAVSLVISSLSVIAQNPVAPIRSTAPAAGARPGPAQMAPLAMIGSKDVETIAWTQYSTVPNGYVKLVTPIVSTQYGNMFMLTIRGYRHGYGDDPIDIRCTGYMVDWAGGLGFKKCQTEGTDLPVEMTTETRPGGTAPVVVIRIGTPTTTWNFPFFGGEYAGGIDYAASAFQFVTGETTPAPTVNTNNVIADDQSGTLVLAKGGLPSFAVKGGDIFGMFVGVGTANPLARFHVLSLETSPLRGILLEQYSPDFIAPQIAIRKSRGTPEAPAAVQTGDNVMKIETQGYDGTAFVVGAAIRGNVDGPVSSNNVPTGLMFTTGVTGSGVERMRITSAGKIGIGIPAPTVELDVLGSANFTGTVTGGNIKAKFQDLAEWVPAAEDLAPGTVVVLDQSRANMVMQSTHAYDTSVAGVVSLQPGIVLGIEEASKEAVATTGRVKVKVDAGAGPIAIGDLLVTSDKPGVAMRSKPIDVGGVAIHRPGTIIGKALERLDRGEGEILVLLSLQ
ncbi:MAG TPA: hypothetical protein VKB93_02405 [Thermoanaerobaculia bacterium]|nr:hypothetical protein [Thermoanaerobaculia bacterium]